MHTHDSWAFKSQSSFKELKTNTIKFSGTWMATDELSLKISHTFVSILKNRKKENVVK